MLPQPFSRSSWRYAFGLVIASLCTLNDVRAQTFIPTSGIHFWNDDNNWSPPPFPNASGATAILSAPTADLTIDLGQPITVGSLTVDKAVSGDFDTTIAGTASNTLTFDGGASSLMNGFSSVGTGLTIVAAPVVFNSTLTVTQGDNDALDFTQSLSGAGGLNVNRDTDGAGVVALSAANTYSGATVLTGSGGDNSLVVRLNDADAIPAASNVALTNSAILELGASDFTRELGPGAGQIQFASAARSGWAAFGADRAVNLGGAAAAVTWSTAGFGQLVLGAPTSDRTVDFQNPLDLDGTTARIIRAYDGAAAADGRISGVISGTADLTKQGNGAISLAASNSYAGNTTVQGGVLMLEHVDALPGATNVKLGSGGVLGLGAADLVRNLGTGPGQIQLVTIGGGGNATNSGFAAYGGNRTVVLNGGAGLTWDSGFFLQGTGNRNFILSDGSADSTVDFQNSIDLGSASRTIVARNGSAAIDAKVSGVISGVGGLNKNNPGTLELSAANTYQGPTTINSGVLLLTNADSIPGGITGGNIANIVVDGNIAVIGLGHGNFTSGLGAGPGQIQFVNNGGFAAYGADRVVNLGGASAQVTWAAGSFVSGSLLFSALDSADAAVDFQNPIDLAGAQRTVVTRNGTAAIDGILSGVISGAAASLEKLGGGTLVLTAANTYDGGTLVNEGRLLVNNTTGSGVGAGDVVVNISPLGGTLGGTGFIGTPADASNVTVNAGAHLAPGSSAGELTVFGDVTLSTGSFFDVEIGGLAAGADYDKLSVNGAASLAGALHIDLLEGFMPASGATFEILSVTGGVTGVFSDVTWTGSTAWQVQYGPTTATLVAVAGLEADYDEDGDVDSADLDRWKMNFGLASGAAHTQGDGDDDGDVDGADFLVWQRQLGGAPPVAAPTAAAVPEPTSLVIFCFAASCRCLRRTRKRAERTNQPILQGRRI